MNDYKKYFMKCKKKYKTGCMLVLRDDDYEIIFWLRDKDDMKESMAYGKSRLKGEISYKVYRDSDFREERV